MIAKKQVQMIIKEEFEKAIKEGFFDFLKKKEEPGIAPHHYDADSPMIPTRWKKDRDWPAQRAKLKKLDDAGKPNTVGETVLATVQELVNDKEWLANYPRSEEVVLISKMGPNLASVYGKMAHRFKQDYDSSKSREEYAKRRTAREDWLQKNRTER